MKKLFAIALIGATLAACNDGETNNEAIANPNSSSADNQTTVAYKAEDGDVTFRDGKLMVMKDGDWKQADESLKLKNGAVVYTDGRVVNDEKEITLQDGEMVNEEGDVFDRAGNAIKSAWKDTKEGVKEAGREIEKGTKKAADKVEDAVDKDKNE
jgi:hypothetical protein